MRRSIVLICLFLVACSNKSQSDQKTFIDTSKAFIQTNSLDTSKNIWIDKLNGIGYSLPDSIGGKPVSFYLENVRIAAVAKALYKGQFRPGDNDSTTKLLSLVTSDDSIIRPFYRWCLDFTISISDGALAEYPGVPALKYATKFPKEFFSYMDKDKTGKRYKQWIEIMAYSGLENYKEESKNIQNQILTKMLDNCQACSSNTKKRLDKFSKDIMAAIKL